MRFPIAALFFIITSFIFFVFWAVSTFIITTFVDAMSPLAVDLGSSSYTNLLTLLPYAFGIFCAIFFVVGIILIFVLDSLSEEPELYYKGR